MLYSATGQFLFRGGVTASRAHIGPNAGSQAIGALLQGQSPQHTHTPVFGCDLFSCAPTP
jgi:hypothetical protein